MIPGENFRSDREFDRSRRNTLVIDQDGVSHGRAMILLPIARLRRELERRGQPRALLSDVPLGPAPEPLLARRRPPPSPGRDKHGYHFGVVLREEENPERKFGAAYVDHKSRVRRWF